MSRICLAWCGLSLFLATVSSSRAGEAVYYAFELDGKPIGSAEIIVDELTLDGQTLQRLRSTTTLKFALLGKTRTTTRRATTLVHSDTGVPSYYDLTQDTNGAVTHVECKFAGDKVQTWQWIEGASKGDPKELSLPAATRILGSNDFSHWGLLTRAAAAQAKDGAAELTVFLPDVGQTQTLRLVLGASQKLDAAGTTHDGRIWQLEGAGIDLLVDAQSGQLVRMNIPAQKTTVTLSDAKVAQNAQQAPVAEILAQHFAQSNIAFDDFLKVRSMKAVIDVSVIGSAVGQDASVLRTAMQEFQGERKGSTIRGTVTIRSVPYAGSQNIPFPAAEPAGPDMAVWLQAEPLIESDDARHRGTGAGPDERCDASLAGRVGDCPVGAQGDPLCHRRLSLGAHGVGETRGRLRPACHADGCDAACGRDPRQARGRTRVRAGLRRKFRTTRLGGSPSGCRWLGRVRSDDRRTRVDERHAHQVVRRHGWGHPDEGGSAGV